MEQKEKKERIPWHPGFCGGIELELRQYREILGFETEHYLSKEPLRMDMLIIKKEAEIPIDHPIAEFFRRHNVVEYKSPRDALTIDDFYKVVGYACLYKGMSETVGAIREKELTISIFRHTKPRELFKSLKDAGAEIEKKHDGVYRVSGIINIPTQIIVMKELKRGAHSVLKILTSNADEYEVRKFVKEANSYRTPIDRQNADAVFEVSISSNEALYERVRKRGTMCKAMERLMKDKLDEREAQGETYGAKKLKEAIFALRDGVKPAEIKKKYGKDIYDSAKEIIKSIA